MTLQELRNELHRTDQAWETFDLDGVLAGPVCKPVRSARLGQTLGYAIG